MAHKEGKRASGQGHRNRHSAPKGRRGVGRNSGGKRDGEQAQAKRAANRSGGANLRSPSRQKVRQRANPPRPKTVGRVVGRMTTPPPRLIEPGLLGWPVPYHARPGDGPCHACRGAADWLFVHHWPNIGLPRIGRPVCDEHMEPYEREKLESWLAHPILSGWLERSSEAV